MRAVLRRLPSHAAAGDAALLLPTASVRPSSSVALLLSHPTRGRTPSSAVATSSFSCLRSYSSHPTNTNDASEDASDLLWSSLEDRDMPSSSPAEAVAASPPQAPNAASSQTYPRDGQGGADGEDHAAAAAATAPSDHVWVTLHNMPRNWLHEDIISFIHHVAQHAGIAPPAASNTHQQDSPEESDGGERNNNNSTNDDDADEEEVGSSAMTSRVVSPFVHHLHIPFGRRTGLVYGTPRLYLTSAKLATYLTTKLTFDSDDFRNRIYFTTPAPHELPKSFQRRQQQQQEEGGERVAQVRYTPIEESMEHEQDEALRTLELDRYLFAPDLLLDIAKSHQRRLVTRNEKVLLDAFVDGEEDADDEEEEDGESGPEEDEERGETTAWTRATSRRRNRSLDGRVGKMTKKKKRGTRVRAGTQKHLGRGSMHNMPIPKPYVEGRQL